MVYSGDDLLPKGSQGVDLAVQGYTIKSVEGSLIQELEFAVLTSGGQAEFFRIEILGQSPNVVEATHTLTKGLGEKTQIVELLCQQREQAEDRPYMGTGTVTKCLITAVNEKA